MACADAMEALSNRPGTAAAETANNLTTSCFFIYLSPHRSASAWKRVEKLIPGARVAKAYPRQAGDALSRNGENFSKPANISPGAHRWRTLGLPAFAAK